MTRMWMGKVNTMCKNHLLGEHKEIHQLIGQLKKKMSIDGYIKNNCIEISSIESRHNEIVNEMISRGYNHMSPIPSQKEINSISKYLPESQRSYIVDVKSSNKDRYARCDSCLRMVVLSLRTK
jgi:hypothetical protein